MPFYADNIQGNVWLKSWKQSKGGGKGRYDCLSLWKWWLWRSTQRMAGDIILDYVIDMSYQVV